MTIAVKDPAVVTDPACPPSSSSPAGAGRTPADPGLWAITGVSALAVLALMIHNGLTVLVASPAFFALAGALAAMAFGMRRGSRRATPGQCRMHDLCEVGLVMTALVALEAVASYQLAAMSEGFHDATLQRWDEAMHFDWLALYRFVVRHPVVQYVGSAAYNSAFLSPWTIVIWHCWRGERAAAREFVITFWCAIVLTLALFPLFPAQGALDYLWHGVVPYSPSNGLDQGLVITGLRSHAITTIDLATVTGLVSAPSFHTACGVLFIVFGWRIRPLRGVIVPLNVLLLLATPVEGSHYASDMVIGALVALMAILAVAMRQPILARLKRAGFTRPVPLAQ
ncbi:phosphatase PAP2 family protein [Novosphingobium sp.]|uniref:phosphatase PAP2 family protein n=1 Tax=Novosphingobium sp. TaxID=1874826 RepID=UPI002FDCF3A0